MAGFWPLAAIVLLTIHSVSCQGELTLTFQIAIQPIVVSTVESLGDTSAVTEQYTTSEIMSTSDEVASSTEGFASSSATPEVTSETQTGDPKALFIEQLADMEISLSIPEVDETELEAFLNESYFNTMAYLRIGTITAETNSAKFAASTKYNYTVIYNQTELDNPNCGGNNCYDCLSAEIAEVQQSIKNSSASIGVGFEVDSENTEAVPQDEIKANIDEELKNTPCSCPREEICYQDGELTTPVCRSICDVFMEENTGCDNDGNFLIYENDVSCKLRDDGDDGYTPYCDCGKSLLLDNIYIYDTCQNMSFIVGMSSGILALILLALSITIGCLACSKNSYQKEAEELKKLKDAEYEAEFGNSGLENPGYGKTWQNPADARELQDIHRTSLGDIKLEPAEGRKQNNYVTTYDFPEERENYKRGPNNLNKHNGYSNQAYGPEPGAPWDSSSAEISDSEAYRNFHPSITHVDPKRDYNIKRPNITVRPMDNMFNMENDKDFPMQSFHI